MKRCISMLLILLLLSACSPAGQAPASQPESDPSPVPGSPSPDPRELLEREGRLFTQIFQRFSTQLPKESYSYYSLRLDETIGKIVLRVGVTDEAAVDAYLASWTGEPWDILVKEPACVSQARQEEFAERAEALELDPAVSLSVSPGDGFFDAGESGKIFVTCRMTDPDAPPEEISRWQELPPEVQALAEEMEIPENMITYQAPQ